MGGDHLAGKHTRVAPIGRGGVFASEQPGVLERAEEGGGFRLPGEESRVRVFKKFGQRTG
jgi:hypothetical protein